MHASQAIGFLICSKLVHKDAKLLPFENLIPNSNSTIKIQVCTRFQLNISKIFQTKYDFSPPRISIHPTVHYWFLKYLQFSYSLIEETFRPFKSQNFEEISQVKFFPAFLQHEWKLNWFHSCKRLFLKVIQWIWKAKIEKKVVQKRKLRKKYRLDPQSFEVNIIPKIIRQIFANTIDF